MPPPGTAVRFTVSAPGLLTTLPSESWVCTVSGPEQLDTISVCGGETMASFAAKPIGLTRTSWVASVSGAVEAVIVTTPDTVAVKERSTDAFFLISFSFFLTLLSTFFFDGAFPLRSLRRSSSFRLIFSTRSKIFLFWICSSSALASSSSISLVTSRISTLAAWIALPRLTISLTAMGQFKTMLSTSLFPLSILLAISTSPSRVRRETDPISRRYIRTGSVSLPKFSISKSPLSSSSFSRAFSSSTFNPCRSSTTSMSISSNIMRTSSI